LALEKSLQAPTEVFAGIGIFTLKRQGFFVKNSEQGFNDVATSLGVAMASVSRILGISVVNGTISATVQNIDPVVNGKVLTLTPILNVDGSISWAWGWSADFPVHLRPKT